jgi:hypothetical protein
MPLLGTSDSGRFPPLSPVSKQKGRKYALVPAEKGKIVPRRVNLLPKVGKLLHTVE